MILIYQVVGLLAWFTLISQSFIPKHHQSSAYKIKKSKLECDSNYNEYPLTPNKKLSKQLKEIISKVNAILVVSQIDRIKPSQAAQSVRGYEAAQSAFSPGKRLYVTPTLPQSALLNSLRNIQNELVAEVQNYLESFVQLISPTQAQELQLQRNDSVLWTNLRINSQRAAGMLIYDNNDLVPDGELEREKSEYYTNDRLMADFKKSQYRKRYLNNLRYDILNLVNASSRANTRESLRYMRNSLNSLTEVAYLLGSSAETVKEEKWSIPVEENPSDEFLVTNPFEEFYGRRVNLPRLVGRARVTLYFQRPGPGRIVESTMNTKDISTVKLILDGINNPYTAGNFLDLCQRKYFDGTVISASEIITHKTRNAIPTPAQKYLNSFSSGRNATSSYSVSKSKEVDFQKRKSETLNITTFGSVKEVYVDPLTETVRRVPLEVLRESKNGTRYVTTSQARNSAIFTRDKPVKSFATVSYHFN